MMVPASRHESLESRRWTPQIRPLSPKTTGTTEIARVSCTAAGTRWLVEKTSKNEFLVCLKVGMDGYGIPSGHLLQFANLKMAQ